MMHTRHYHTNPVALALAGILGAAVGIIFAPKKGEEVREDIKRDYLQLRANVMTEIDDLKRRFEDDWSDVKHSLHK